MTAKAWAGRFSLGGVLVTLVAVFFCPLDVFHMALHSSRTATDRDVEFAAREGR